MSSIPHCGVIMPISSIDNCNESHWVDVKEIIFSSITAAGFEPNLVSDADDVGLIHQRIVQNLYQNDIIVCDISGRNPNVMLELGMRLAFDKPTVIIKDDKTPYSFDTAAIEHLEYPRDLRHNVIESFKIKLTGKIKATFEKFKTDPSSTTFLGHFGKFKVAKIGTEEVSVDKFVIGELSIIRQMLSRMESDQRRRAETAPKRPRQMRIPTANLDEASISSMISAISDMTGVASVFYTEDKNDPYINIFVQDQYYDVNFIKRIENLLELHSNRPSKIRTTKTGSD